MVIQKILFAHSVRATTTYTIIPCKTLKQNCRFCTQPKHRDVILFPGQGSQFVGMAETLTKMPAVKQLFKMANQILGYDLLGLCLKGPKAELDKTMYCQPAVFVASIAALEKYKEMHSCLKTSNSTVAAGFSVGELAALVFSKALTFEDGLRLVDVRAKAMQLASYEKPSGMVTVTGLHEKEVQDLLKSVHELCKEDVQIRIASYLYSKGFVLAGDKTAIDCLMKLPVRKIAKKDGKMSQLAVSGAFHTPLMKSAQPVLAQALNSMNVQMPEIRVYSNVTGKPYESTEDVKRLLPKQIVEPVRWQAIMNDICQSKNEQTFYEVGPGRQLSAILAKTDRRLVRKSKNFEG